MKLKKLLLLLFLTLLSSSLYAEIGNDIILNRAGIITSSIPYYQKGDLLQFTYTTPVVYLQTGEYGWSREDKIESCSTQCTITLNYEDKIIPLVVSEPTDRGITGRNVTLSPFSYTYTSTATLGTILGLSDNDSTPKISFEIVFAFHVETTYKKGFSRGKDFFVSSYFNLYTCKGGEIQVDESVMPNISPENASPIYGLYNQNNNTQYAIISKRHPNTFNLPSDEWVSWNITDGNRVLFSEQKRIDNNLSDFDHYLKYADFLGTNNKLENHATRYVNRVYSNKGFNCHSNILKIQTVDTLSLEGFDENELIQYICAESNTEENDTEKLTCDSKSVFTIKGKSVNWNKINYPDTLYHVSYGWEYKSSTNGSWTTVTDNLNEDPSNPNLCLKSSKLSPDKKYYFRQFLIVKRFGNRKVYANGENNHVTVLHYQPILKSDFILKEFNPICQDALISDTLKVIFKPQPGKTYKNVGNNEFYNQSNNFHFSITSETDPFNQAIQGDSISIPFNLQLQSTIHTQITIEDGCENKISFPLDIKMAEKPQLLKTYIDIEGGSANYADPTSETLKVYAPEGQNITLKINSQDGEKNSCRYFISYRTNEKDENGVNKWSERSAINTIFGHTISAYIPTQDWFNSNDNYIKIEKENLTSGCLSNPIYINITYLGSIQNNKIEFSNTPNPSIAYVCNNQKNPRILGENISGGYGDSTYSFVWQYSNDTINWINMSDNNGALITTASLKENDWDKSIGKTYYIRRMATSLGINATESSAIKSFSNVLQVMPYTSPILHLLANGQEDDLAVCHKSTTNLSFRLENQSIIETEEYPFNIFYAYETYAGAKQFLQNQQRNILNTQDTILYAATEFCKDTIFSINSIRTKVGEDLTIPKDDIHYGPCLVRGDSIELFLTTKSDYEYGFIYGTDTITKSSCSYRLPTMGSLFYSVFKRKGDCIKTVEYSIEQNEMKEPLSHSELTASSSGLTLNNNLYAICYGNPVSISVRNEKNNNDIEYEWRINNTLLDSINSSKALTTAAFDMPGKNYIVTRTSHLVSNNTSCQTLIDTIHIQTYPVISGAKVTSNKDSVCYGESVHLSIDQSSISGASHNYSFSWNKTDNTSSETESQGQATEHNIDALFHTSAFNVIVSDKYCSHPAYEYTSISKLIYVENNLDFSLTATPSTINSQTIHDGSSVAINISSDNLSPSEKISCWMNTQEIKNKETYLSGITYSLKESDFIDNIASFTVERYGMKLNQCKQTSIVEVLLNDGFDGVPVILSSHSTKAETISCEGDTITLSIDIEQLPKYDNKIIDAEQFTYQWYKRNQESWSTCGSFSQIKVKATAGVKDEYRCKLTYIPNGGTRQTVLSDIHTVKGIQVIPVGNISFVDEDDKHTKTFYVCKGETGLLTLTTDSTVMASQYQWYQRTAGEEWVPVAVERGTTGIDNYLCTIDLENYNRNTSFKLVCQNSCGVQSESVNQIQLLFNVGASLSADDITIISNTIYEGKALRDISLCIPKDYNNTYFWSCDPSFISSSWKSGNPITLDNGGKGFTKGIDSIFVYMVSKGKGNCLSDTITYHFNVYEELTSSNISFSNNQDTICANNGALTLMINEIKGGDDSYQVDWMYKSKSMNSFSAIKEEANMPFDYLDIAEGKNALGGYSFLNISNLTESCEFYAVISCQGNYPGKSYNTNTKKKSVYAPLSSGEIDNHTLLFCYNDAIASIIGDDAHGGDHHYSYQWLQSTDMRTWSPINEQTEVAFSGHISQDLYKLKQSTYFCRVVSDGCGNHDTSLIKTIQVKDEVIAQKNHISYTPLIPRGDKAKMWGIDNNFEYVWFDYNHQILDTTIVRDVYSTQNMNVSFQIYYAKILYDGCLSTNYDTIRISSYDIDGGHLSFDNFIEGSASNKYWICSGADAGKISADGGGNLTYRWFYMINGNENSRSYPLYSASNTSLPVSTSSVLLDTCNLKTVLTHASGTQIEKKISFYRISYFTIDGIEKTESSDTINLYIVPALNLTANLLLEGNESMAGTISAEKEIYCAGESGDLIDGTVLPNSTLYNLWSNGSFGPYLYDKEAEEFSTWFEYNKNGQWEKSDIHYGISDYAQYFNLTEIDTIYSIRRAFDDGCSTSYSNIVKQNLSDKKPNPSKIIIKGITPEGKSITEGFELGDALSINYTELGYDCYWFADEDCTDTLVANNQLITFDVITKETPTTIYLKRKDNSENGCFSSALAIPLTIYTKSNGGYIYKDQFKCINDPFETITNGRLADGFSYAPSNGIPRNFIYQWQISTDNQLSVWSNINNATNPDSLPANLINTLRKKECSVYHIRRMATTETGRVCYSDTISLVQYNELKAGTLSFENYDVPELSFCQDDSLPTIISSKPTDGYYGYYDIDGYSYNWEISINGKEYQPITTIDPIDPHRLDLEQIIHYNNHWGFDVSQNNLFKIRVRYKDTCEEVISNTLYFTLWAETTSPSIYQDKDSCQSDAITIKAYDTDEYTFTWVILDNNGQVTWSYTQDSLKLQRISEIAVTEYGVIGTHKRSGCKSHFTYFNIDSLPVLSQEPLLAPTYKICFDDSIEIKGGKVFGGNGLKSYVWESSVNDSTYMFIASSEDLQLNHLKHDLYIRRIVSDQCSTDTSNSILIKVQPEIVLNTDIIAYEKPCKGEHVRFYLNPSILDSLQMQNESFDINDYVWEISDEYNNTFFLSSKENQQSITLDGFTEETPKYHIQLIYQDNSDKQCYSEKQTLTVSAIAHLDTTCNKIECDNPHPCNGSLALINVSSPTNTETNHENIEYAWYQSPDQKVWTKMAGQFNGTSIQIEDTLYVKRVLTNHCESISSNIVSLYGQKKENLDYRSELDLNIVTFVTDQTDSVNMIIRNHNIDTDYTIIGDMELPDLQFGTTKLPYPSEVYKNTGLYLLHTKGCFNAYPIKPIRGGRIYSEGEITLCPNSDVPTLRVTEVEGGTGEYNYQWQYKTEFIKEFVNIENATKADYTPSPVNVKTWFRRVTTSDEYSSYSNEVILSISENPQVSTIQVEEEVEEFTSRGLSYSNLLIERTPNLPLTLSDSVYYAKDAYWEYSSDNVTWTKIASESLSVPSDPTAGMKVTLEITDNNSPLYYRLTAENSCKSISSKSLKVITIDVPEILDDEIRQKGFNCQGDTLAVACYYRNEDGKYINGPYTYSYSNTIGAKMYVGDFETYTPDMQVNQYVFFPNLQESIDITITRTNHTSGASTSKTIHISVNSIKANFSYLVNKQTYDVKEDNIRLEQGDLVSFINLSEGDIISYHWQLIEALNTPQNVAPYGLESYRENPDCYFYNEGRYNIKLTVTDNNGCVSSISDNALFIPSSSVHKSYLIDASFTDNEPSYISSEEQNEPIIYPTLFNEEINIYWPGHTIEYWLFDESGILYLTGNGYNKIRIYTGNLSDGNYILKTNDKTFKLLRSKTLSH